MRAVITAAARSPRLLPLTKHVPVSLLQVGSEVIIGRQLEALQRAGISDALVITGFCADQVEEFCRGKASCVFNPFYDECNVAMNLWLVRQELESGFVLLYDDILFQRELIEEVLGAEDGILLVADRRGVDKEAEKVAIRQGVLSAIGKDVAAPYGEFIGVAKFTDDVIPGLVAELEMVARADLQTSFPQLIQRLVERGHPVKVHATDHPWSDIDFPADLEEARRMWGR